MANANETLGEAAITHEVAGVAASTNGGIAVASTAAGPTREQESEHEVAVEESVEDPDEHTGEHLTAHGGKEWERGSQPDPEKAEDRDDLEMARTVTGPPYSVFSKRKKQYIVFMASVAGFFSPLSANIYFPALNVLAADLHTSNALINLTLTSYMIFQGLAPTIMGDLADMSGRRPAYIIGFIIYIAACIGIALQDSFAALFVLRCIQSTGSSGTIALGMGVVADISTSSERGSYMGWATGGMLIGPAIGPIIGGILAQYLGWRSIFWFLVILAGVFFVPFIITFPETGRNVVGNGSIPPQGWNMSLLNYFTLRKASQHPQELQRTNSQQSARSARDTLAKKRKFRIPNPIRTLKVCMEKDMFVILITNSIIYVAFMDVAASLPYLFQQIYGYDELQVGLSFIPYGVGSFLAAPINGRIMDIRFKRIAAEAGISVDKKRATDMVNFPLEKARIPIALVLVLVGNAALLVYAWALQYRVHVAVPLIMLFIMGYFLTGSFSVMNVLLVDLYPSKPATATAANNLVRCSMGAIATAVIIYMIDSMGVGWCFTFIALLVLAFTSLLFVISGKGPQWRRERFDREVKQEEEKKSRESEAERVEKVGGERK